jgi:hypothetical protein
MMCYSVAPFDTVMLRLNGGCMRNFTYLDPCKDFNPYPIIEPFYHCEPGVLIPLMLALCGLIVFGVCLKKMGVQ